MEEIANTLNYSGPTPNLQISPRKPLKPVRSLITISP